MKNFFSRTLVEDGVSLNGTSLFELRYDESEHSVRCILNIEESSRSSKFNIKSINQLC
jgi:hypothetical protein